MLTALAHGGRNRVVLAAGEAGMTPERPGSRWYGGPESPRKHRGCRCPRPARQHRSAPRQLGHGRRGPWHDGAQGGGQR